MGTHRDHSKRNQMTDSKLGAAFQEGARFKSPGPHPAWSHFKWICQVTSKNILPI